MPDDITIRFLTSHDDLRRCEEIQRQTWHMRDLEIVAMHSLIATNMHGGITLGAEVGGELVGFLFGYPGWLPADSDRAAALGMRAFHASQMMGVLPEFQNRGIGYLLKREQRRIALEQGLRLATWTFDPLLSRNAHFNITRLGATARHYIRNLYDELPGINAGLPTDRLEVEWWLASEQVSRRMDDPERTGRKIGWERVRTWMVNQTEARPDGLRVPDESLDRLVNARVTHHPFMAVEIPVDIDRIKLLDMALALRWRLHIRAALEAAFKAGYAIAGLSSEEVDGEHRSAYLLFADQDARSLSMR